MITVQHLAKRFRLSRQQRRTLGARGDTLQAVDDLSFTAKPGEIFALLGPNGAGKTTALRMIATLLRPDAGQIHVAGVDALADPVGARRRLGFLTGSTKLYERLTADEIVRYYAALAGVSEADYRRRRDALFGALGIDAFAGRRVGKLSTGMQQKVSIARTIAHDPPVLVFDEPTVALDVLAALDMRAVIGELRDAGKTVLFSTHVMSEAEKLCDRIAIIHEGRIHTTGTLTSLREETGLHYLEDIFVHYVRQARRDGEGAVA